MSTRGWYEYYVIDPVSGHCSLAMQFYKWGDAVPEHALDEWQLFQQQLDQAEGLFPVEWLDDLLRDQLGSLYGKLPVHFSIAAFLFLIQRAEEARNSFPNLDYDELPKNERPDYRLGFAIGKAMTLHQFRPLSHPDPLLDMVLGFIATGHFVRPWREYGLTWSVLQWLQYLTQVTLKTEMGSIAGQLNSPFDIHFLYRYFVWIDPTQPFKITRLAIELCDAAGDDLFVKLEDHPGKDAGLAQDHRQQADKLLSTIRSKEINLFSLRQAESAFELETDTFWAPLHYERPSLPTRCQHKRC
ncbi:MAG: hypothetical protein VBE63_21750 [Lamprobacter sp.]|uniref:hypothetical protein n=1 Tax=Lamprobacter sp. TaxID=3100796 RepID=UPI002B2577F1|nr:hypothetical protein [Lamprobacter sp.]MEA3642542.1 hypothetical protein [Lamprobacter sp.]